MKTKLVLIGAFGLSVLAAILLIVGPGGSANQQPSGAYQPVVTSNGAVTFRPEERARMSVVMDGAGANPNAAPRKSTPSR